MVSAISSGVAGRRWDGSSEMRGGYRMGANRARTDRSTHQDISLDDTTKPCNICAMHTPELSRLAHLAERAAAEQPDLIAALTDTIKRTDASDADPYLAIGAMIEGIAHTSPPVSRTSGRPTPRWRRSACCWIGRTSR